MTVYLTGNSHIVALAQAASQSELLSGTSLELEGICHRYGTELMIFAFGRGNLGVEPFSIRTESGVAFTHPRFAANLTQAVGSNEITPGDTWALMMPQLRANFLDVWRDYRLAGHGAGQAVQSVSRAVAMSAIEADLASHAEFFRQLQDAGVDFFALDSPPLRRECHATVNLGYPLAHVKEVDDLARQYWREWLSRQGIISIEAPPETIDAEGFMKPEFEHHEWIDGRDLTHGNLAYGRLMLGRVLDHLASRGIDVQGVAA